MPFELERRKREVDNLLSRMQATLTSIDNHVEELQELASLARIITRVDDAEYECANDFECVLDKGVDDLNVD